MSRPLRHGYTTGACAAAAAKGAALLLRDGVAPESVAIDLPAGFVATFPLHGPSLVDGTARCCVIKDAGDDPDVTHGCEVWAEVRRFPAPSPDAVGGIVIQGGTGIGRVTKPGLAVAVGEWAINPVPRRMIETAVREVFLSSFILHPSSFIIEVTLSIPDGEERAKRTLNARLGILGGLSLLGTSGVVKPISTRAWTDTLDAALDVAKAGGCERVVLSTGRSSELVAQSVTELPEEAYLMMGDHVGYALRAAAERGFSEVVLCGQFAKVLKIACGHQQTHVSSSTLDLRTLAGWLEAAGFPAARVAHCRTANTAREVLLAFGNDAPLIELVCGRAQRVAQALAPGSTVKVLLAGYAAEVLYFA